MGRRQDLIAVYADELINKCGMQPDMALLEKVAIGCGPAIFDPEQEFVTDSAADLMMIRRNFLVRKMALEDGPRLTEAIREVMANYGAPDTPKYRAVVYYMLVKLVHRESQYL